jgi:hypothetical protein
MCGLGKRFGFARRRERPLANNSFRMDSSMVRFISRHFEHGLKNLPGQVLLIRF